MKIILFILIPFLSASAQERRVGLHGMPDTIQVQVKNFKDAILTSEGNYVVETYVEKGICVETTYAPDGRILEVTESYKPGISWVGVGIACAMIAGFIYMIIPKE
jgi:hypothetical protein